MGEPAPRPRPEHDRLGFIKTRLGLVMIDAEALVVVNVIGAAAAEPDDEPAFHQIVEERHLLREPDWMVERRL